MTPDEIRQVKFTLEALAQHYPRRTRTDAETALWLSDWYADLEGFAPGQIADACDAWRRSDAKAFPRSRDLTARMQTGPARSVERAETWRQMSDHQLADLSLRDKIRYHELAAYHAMSGWRSATRQVDDDWRRRARIRDNHVREAKRLASLIPTESEPPARMPYYAREDA